MKEQFTVNDIKPGMVVEYRNKKRALVVDCGYNVIALMGFNIYNYLDSYMDNLEAEYAKYSIDKVYKITPYVHTFEEILKSSHLQLIWERKK